MIFKKDQTIVYLNNRNIRLNVLQKSLLFGLTSSKLYGGTEINFNRFKDYTNNLIYSRYWQRYKIQIGKKFLLPLSLNNIEERFFFIFKRKWFHLFLTSFYSSLRGLNRPFTMRFTTIGYNFKIMILRRRKVLTKRRRERRSSFLLLRIGYCYRFCVKLPKTVWIRRRSRRALTLMGVNSKVFFFVITYLRNLHNLFPYKRKGLAFKDEKMVMKQGKKTRYR